jgi:hypothetical protein
MYSGMISAQYSLTSSKIQYTATKITFMYRIPFLGIARPQSQFPHSCVCEQFGYSQHRSTYLAAAEQTDQSGNTLNLSQIYE